MNSLKLMLAGGLASWLVLSRSALSAEIPEPPAGERMTPGPHTYTLTVDGVKRSYVVHVPRAYDPAKKWPVVMMFHGGGGTAQEAMRDTGWAEKAEQAGFLAVFPEGTPEDPTKPPQFRGNPQTWNDGSQRSNLGAVQRGTDDVKFVSRLLADLKTHLSVDEQRIYATGFSNGASMTFRVARELSPIFAAVAPVAGADWLANLAPAQPVPLLYITGTADPLNPFDGGTIHIGLRTYGRKPPTQEMIRQWVKLFPCPETAWVVYDRDGAKGVAYGAATNAPSVVLYTLAGHGHHWPGGKSLLPESFAGKDIAKLKATDVIWEFFRTNAKK